MLYERVVFLYAHSTVYACEPFLLPQVQSLCAKLIVIRGSDRLSREAQTNATQLFTILLRSTLASKRVIKEYRLNSTALVYLLGEIETRFLEAVAFPGESVGTIAAQSIGITHVCRKTIQL